MGDVIKAARTISLYHKPLGKRIFLGDTMFLDMEATESSSKSFVRNVLIPSDIERQNHLIPPEGIEIRGQIYEKYFK